MSCVWVLQKGHSDDGCGWRSISSDLLMCGGGARTILLLPLVDRCLETIDECIWRLFVFMSIVATVLGSVGMFVENSVF